VNCLLCHTSSFLNIDKVFDCAHCGLVFKNPENHFDLERDIKRYSTHNNSSDDSGYIDFLNNLVKPLSTFLPKSFSAIDFGCGPGPSLSILLSDLGGVVENYDPIFLKNDKALLQTFDVVTCSEVVEHFKKPDQDWNQLISLIKPNGLLAIMTLLISPDINYKSWWYKNDPTHVVFYSEATLIYLAKRFELDIIFNDKKSVIIFRKK
jgi:hypothetical protein